MEFSHSPVMLEECLAALAIKPEGNYLDGTAGGGGHAEAIARRLAGGRLYALDQDPDAVAAAAKRLAGLPAQVIQENFRNAPAALTALGAKALDGALLDLGVSSHQLDVGERGFSYHADAPLDMRMSQSGPTAAQLLKSMDRQQLADTLRRYGEEPYAWQIAGKIEQALAEGPVETTGKLSALVAAAVPPAVRRKDKNPARRTFQALRMAVNGEMEALDEGLEGIFQMLKPGGRLVVLTFHSLEDRLVKQRFKDWATACTCPKDLPVCVCGRVAQGKPVNKKPITATEAELEANRRSRSAKLRAIEKLPAPPLPSTND